MAIAFPFLLWRRRTSPFLNEAIVAHSRHVAPSIHYCVPNGNQAIPFISSDTTFAWVVTLPSPCGRGNPRASGAGAVGESGPTPPFDSKLVLPYTNATGCLIWLPSDYHNCITVLLAHTTSGVTGAGIPNVRQMRVNPGRNAVSQVNVKGCDGAARRRTFAWSEA